MEALLRLFVSSPGDVAGERRRVDLVVERLNSEFVGRVRIETVRWELSYYSAHATFQRQIPEAADCDVVVAVFRGRLGTPLPASFPPLPSGEPYPSGTAYEVLSALEVRRAGKRVPDVYVFRYPDAPSVGLDAPDRADIEVQWARLKQFFDTWFRTQAGEFLAAFQTYVSTDDFALKVEDCLRQWLAQRGYLAQGAVWDRVLHGSPFPGLEAFDAGRGRVFFGREVAIAQAVGRLQGAEQGGRLPFLLVIGASGSGKSSLLRAGLIPRLVMPGTIPEVDAWRVAVLMPNVDPFAALADALFADAALGEELRAGTFRTREMLAKQMAGDADLATAPLRDALERVAARRQEEAGFDAPRAVRLALGIDQAERLFSEASPEKAAGMAALLSTLVHQRLATVVMVLRSDAYAAFQGSEALVALREGGATLDLLAPTAAELEEIVTKPVALCDPALAFEQRGGESLAALLVSDARGGDALPLLQVSLARLYAAEAGRGDGVLRFADYSGMDEAVTETANEALGQLDAAARAALPALVAGLVSDVSTDPRSGAAVPVVSALDRAAFETTPARTALVDAFVARRLLTSESSGGRGGGGALVRPVHDALLRIWPEAVAIVAETASLIRVRHTLVPLTRAWMEAAEADKAGHLELSAALLDGAQSLLARLGSDLPEGMREFIEAAAAADAVRRDRERQEQERRIRDAEALAAARRRTARRTLVGLAVAVVLAVLAGWQSWQAQQQRNRAQRSLDLATQTANDLVLNLANKLGMTVGIPIAIVQDILGRARQLQDLLLASEDADPKLRGSQAAALLITATTLAKSGDTFGALGAAEKARSILQVLVKQYPESVAAAAGLALCHGGVAEMQATRGDFTSALASYQASSTITLGLLKADARNTVLKETAAFSERNVGFVLEQLAQLDAADTHLMAALQLAQAAAADTPNNEFFQRFVAILRGDLGDILLLRGDLPSAEASFATGRALEQRMIEEHPENSQFRIDQLAFERRAGEVAVARGDLAGAQAGYQLQLDHAQQLATADPETSNLRMQVATAYADLGSVQLKQGDAVAALATGRIVLKAWEGLAQSDPDNLIWQYRLLLAHMLMGNVQRAQADGAGAGASYQAALAIGAQMLARAPQRARWKFDLWQAYEKLGGVQLEAHEVQPALTSFSQASAIATELAASTSGFIEWQRGLVVLDRETGDALLEAGQGSAAVAAYRAGLALATRLAAAEGATEQDRQAVGTLEGRIEGAPQPH